MTDTDVIVQLNFNTGAGDLYCALSQLLTFSKNCNSSGLSVGFIYNFNNNQYFHDSDYVLLDRFFDMGEFKDTFSYVKKVSTKEEIPGYSYLYTPYLYTGEQKGGRHWWDLFVNNSYENISSVQNKVSVFCMRELPRTGSVYYVPKFSNRIQEIAPKFSSDTVGLHIRNFDQSDSLQLILERTSKITELLFSSPVYVCSNSAVVRKHFSDSTNSLLYSPRHPSISYQYGTFKWDKNITEEQLLENFEDTLVEMYNLSQCTKLYSLTEWGRPTNFLFYAKSHNKDLEIINL